MIVNIFKSKSEFANHKTYFFQLYHFDVKYFLYHLRF